jgi:hypothetical protein
VVRQRSAKPLFIGSNPIGASLKVNKAEENMASNTKKTKTKRANRKAKMNPKRKKEACKPGTYKLLPLKDGEEK